ncbi:hypothetical protein [Goodfellowiella coeruleoviolacea]|uniref:Uncharacterized protein n=1 Tax=Goodfellowiella coeruleoviolacea TaxID=334858 RepID=A0AAE3GEQ9_9PSEU|nr:hypothetical protein [Goodfellowiella coeruleoviolacea]MCP2165972.1 hypothetical protein [Goodfellowiella coeruleoviolacea]
MDSRDVDEELALLVSRKWTLYYFGGREQPRAIGAVYQYPCSECADVVLIRGEWLTIAFRTPTDEHTDVFRPEQVVWWYGSATLWALRAVFQLAPPGDLRAPHLPMPAPGCCRLAPELTKPLVVRPPRFSGRLC